MHDLRNTRRRKHLCERREIGERQRINARSVAAGRQLHQAQLGSIGTLPQEFGIQAYVLRRFELCGELGEGSGCRDYRLQRLKIIWLMGLYNPAMHIMRFKRRYTKL
jgi:hypothetical protein